jgi:hypothetical protein
VRARYLLTGCLILALGCSQDEAPGLTVTGPGPTPPDTDVVDTDAVDTDVETPPEDVTPDPDIVAPDDILKDILEPDPDEGPDVEDAPDVTPPDPDQPDFVTCDAGDEAWAKAVIPVLLGRKPRGIREVRAIADLVVATDRATVARGLMNSPEFADRWQQWFMDEVRVNRVGDKSHTECYGPGIVGNDGGTLAATIRDSVALNTETESSFNMTDVLRSSLALDDMSPFYRAHLFAMLAKPLTGANVGQIALDITRRQDFGEIFEATYLHRNTVCAGCHNSSWSTTDNADEAKDHHWPLPGLVERGVYGSDTGRPEMEVYSIWRHLGIVRDSGGTRPWGMSATCGHFNAPEDISPDPAEYESFFIEDQGFVGSIWAVEAALQQGFDSLRANGAMTIDETTGEVDGYESFAYMLSTRIVNQVWREVIGYPLTLVHYFPRNKEQRDILLELTTHFVVEQWSLKTLLVDVVTHPLFNDNAPTDGCAPNTGNPYIYPPVFNPWVLQEEEEAERDNSIGDMMHRYGARTLLHMVAEAMKWAESPGFPDGSEETFQKSIGMFVKDAEPGFDGVDFQGLLSWEARYAACKGVAVGGGDPDSCLGNCGGQAPSGCFCDDQCAGFGDCCDDQISVCVDGEIPPDAEAADWIDLFVVAAGTWSAQNPDLSLSIADAAAGIKDRLLTSPDIDPGFEGQLIADLMGVDSIAVPLTEVADWPDRLRRYCGALLETPQFLLAGVPAADQLVAPKVVVAGESYKDHCEKLSGVIFNEADWDVTCEDNSVVVLPTPEPEPTPEPAE